MQPRNDGFQTARCHTAIGQDAMIQLQTALRGFHIFIGKIQVLGELHLFWFHTSTKKCHLTPKIQRIRLKRHQASALRFGDWIGPLAESKSDFDDLGGIFL